MEGIYILFLVAMGGAAVFGAVAGLLFPGKPGLISIIAVLITFGAIVAEDFRLNRAIGSFTPYLVYAIIAALAAVPALIGAALASRLRNSKG